MGKTFKVVMWPDVQDYMEKDGFEDNSYLINDDKGLEEYGSSAYFVDTEWLEETDKQAM